MDDADVGRVAAALRDRWWRLNNLYWIVDKDGQRILFRPNPVQQELDDNLHYRNIILKSRQHGVTTWSCIRALDGALFRANYSACIIAHTAGDANKFFRQKVLYAYDNLPLWLRQRRSAKRRDLREGILELCNDSRVEVSVSARGGTHQFLHVSEYGPMCALYPQRSAEVASGALNTISAGNIAVIESTAHGASGDFYQRCQMAADHERMVRAGQGSSTAMDWRLFFFGWYLDPQNTIDPDGVPVSDEMQQYFDGIEQDHGVTIDAGQRAWYVKKSQDQRQHMKREFPSTPTEAFEGSSEGAYYGELMAEAEAEGRVTDLPLSAHTPVHTFWDIGHSDSTAIWFMQEVGPWFHFIDYYEASGEQSAHFSRMLATRAQQRGYVYGKHYLPHDIEVTEWVGTGDNSTRKEILEKGNVKPIVVVPRIQNIGEGIDMVRRMLPRCRFDRARCGPPKAGGKRRGGIAALKNYTKRYNPQTEAWQDQPAHTWASHAADAFRQFAQGYSTPRVRMDTRARARSNENWKVQ